jgi:asparagine synthase (glutamine-hydrolysing)
VLYDYVPKEFFNRPKWGFSIPLAKWLKTDLHYLIEKYLNEEVVIKCNAVNFEKVKLLVARFEAGEEYLFNRIWVLILLHRWLNESNK